MKILFNTGGDEFTSPREQIDDDLSDAGALVFRGTEIAHAERDDENNFTIYTEGGHFYITLTAADVEQIAALAIRRLPQLEIFYPGANKPSFSNEMTKLDASGNPNLYGVMALGMHIFVDTEPQS